jgi:YHS domain-containing protein
MKNRWTLAAGVACAITLLATLQGRPADSPAPAAASYPLDTCVVSGSKLGSMGEAVVLRHEGREVRFCCAGCVDTFKKDPAKYLAILDAAARKKAPAGNDAPVNPAPEAPRGRVGPPSGGDVSKNTAPEASPPRSPPARAAAY